MKDMRYFMYVGKRTLCNDKRLNLMVFKAELSAFTILKENPEEIELEAVQGFSTGVSKIRVTANHIYNFFVELYPKISVYMTSLKTLEKEVHLIRKCLIVEGVNDLVEIKLTAAKQRENSCYYDAEVRLHDDISEIIPETGFTYIRNMDVSDLKSIYGHINSISSVYHVMGSILYKEVIKWENGINIIR